MYIYQNQKNWFSEYIFGIIFKTILMIKFLLHFEVLVI